MDHETEQDQRPESLTERRTAALRMRLSGATYAAIAENHGHSTSRAHADVAAALADVTRDSAEIMLGRQLFLIADLRAVLIPRTEAGDLDAIAALLAVMDHEARLLGLYAAVKTETTFARATDDE